MAQLAYTHSGGWTLTAIRSGTPWAPPSAHRCWGREVITTSQPTGSRNTRAIHDMRTHGKYVGLPEGDIVLFARRRGWYQRVAIQNDQVRAGGRTHGDSDGSNVGTDVGVSVMIWHVMASVCVPLEHTLSTLSRKGTASIPSISCGTGTHGSSIFRPSW